MQFATITIHEENGTMEKPNRHIFVCASFRMGGVPLGACNKKGSGSLLNYLETEIADRGLEGVVVSMTGCLKYCEKGPVMVVYPDNHWYGEVTEEKIDAILDSFETNTGDENYRM